VCVCVCVCVCVPYGIPCMRLVACPACTGALRCALTHVSNCAPLLPEPQARASSTPLTRACMPAQVLQGVAAGQVGQHPLK